MFRVFNLLDRASDALAHAFDDHHAPEGSRSRPDGALYLLVLALIPCALVLSWELSPWVLGVLGLIVGLISAALYVIWASI